MAKVKELLKKLEELEQLKKEFSVYISDAYGNVIEIEAVYEDDSVRFYMTGEHCRFIIALEGMKKLANWLYKIGLVEERGGDG